MDPLDRLIRKIQAEGADIQEILTDDETECFVWFFSGSSLSNKQSFKLSELKEIKMKGIKLEDYFYKILRERVTHLPSFKVCYKILEKFPDEKLTGL